MMSRCHNEKNKNYKNYGGRGIVVIPKWHDYVEFKKDMGMRPKGYTIERIDNDGNYEPSNCEWIFKSQQAYNKRNNKRIEYKGETKTVFEWAVFAGIRKATFANRIRAGWDMEKALYHPVREFGNKTGKNGR
jgi:hypothetical protein